MKIITCNPPENVMAIGKFESLHLGHQSLIHKAKEAAAKRGLPTVVMSFCPHPFIVLGNKDYKPLLSTEEAAWVLREICKVDFFLQYPFNKDVALMSPEAFCRILFKEQKVKVLFVGEDYRFGINRSGTVEILQNEAKKHGASITIVPFEKRKGIQISTSLIRSLIEDGNFSEASKLLGFEYPVRFQNAFVKQRLLLTEH